MYRSRIVASLASVAVAATLFVAPATALETSVSQKRCTFKLNISEQEEWDAAVKQKNNINEESLMPFSVDIKDAKKTKSSFDEKLNGAQGLVYLMQDQQDALDAQTVAEDDIPLYKGNVAVIKQIQKHEKAYKNALDACANGKPYDSSKDDSVETKPDTGNSKDAANTSSQMPDELLYTLLGLLGTAAFTGVAYVVSHGGINLGNVKLPF